MRGGKREGAGRKKLSDTKVVRVRAEINVKKLISLEENLKTLVHAWKQELHETSPRDHTAKIMLAEIEELLKD